MWYHVAEPETLEGAGEAIGDGIVQFTAWDSRILETLIPNDDSQEQQQLCSSCVLSIAEQSSGAWRIMGGFQMLSTEPFLLANFDFALFSLPWLGPLKIQKYLPQILLACLYYHLRPDLGCC